MVKKTSSRRVCKMNMGAIKWASFGLLELITSCSNLPSTGKTPWTEESGRLQFMGSHRVGHDWATWTCSVQVGQRWTNAELLLYSKHCAMCWRCCHGADEALGVEAQSVAGAEAAGGHASSWRGFVSCPKSSWGPQDCAEWEVLCFLQLRVYCQLPGDVEAEAEKSRIREETAVGVEVSQDGGLVTTVYECKMPHVGFWPLEILGYCAHGTVKWEYLTGNWSWQGNSALNRETRENKG